MTQEWRLGEYIISTDKHLLDLSAIHSFLTRSYWAEGIPFETVKKSIEHSLTFGVYTAPLWLIIEYPHEPFHHARGKTTHEGVSCS